MAFFESSGSSFSFEGFLALTVVAALWLYYIIFFNSRLWGLVVTLILRKLVRGAYVRVGSFAVSILAGKILFRDVSYVTTNFSIRVVDGTVCYRWWKRFADEQDYLLQDPATDRDESQDGFHCTCQISLDCPLKVVLNGFEMHVYNRTGLYNNIEEVFNGVLNQKPNVSTDGDACDDAMPSTGNETWRRLIPAVYFHISSGKVAFGNRLVPNTVSFHFESGSGFYTTSKADSLLDPFRHVVKMNCKAVKVKLSESHGYVNNNNNNKRDVAPRQMGDGYIVAKSNSVKLCYLWDEAGLIPIGWETTEEAPPLWSMSIKLGHDTEIMHGPWVRRQRIHLQQFFFPIDYQKAPITERPLPGTKRQYAAFDLDVEVTNKMMLNVLFSSQEQDNLLLYVGIDQGSHFHLHLPWIVDESGYTMTLRGCLKQVDVATSLEYRRLAKAKEISLDMTFTYPRQWNHPQVWEWNITASETTIRFFYIHVPFFQALMDDWSSGYSPDLLHFVPMTLNLKLTVNDFELLCFVNHFNWLDTAPAVHTEKENAMLAFCGRQLSLSTFFPFIEFQPRHQSLNFDIQGNKIVLRLCVPESRGSYSSIQALIHSNNQQFTSEEEVWLLHRQRSYRALDDNRDEDEISEEYDVFIDGTEPHVDNITWRGDTVVSDGWFDCWFAQNASVQFVYASHPALLYEHSVDLSDVIEQDVGSELDDSDWRQEPDHLEVHIDVYDSTVRLFGSIIKHILDFKNNYFGVYQPYHVFSSTELAKQRRGLESIVTENEEKRPYRKNVLSSSSNQIAKHQENYLERQLEVVFRLTAHDNTAQLPVHVGGYGGQRHLPVVKTPTLHIEFKKNVDDGQLRIDLSNVQCFMSDPNQSMTDQGFLLMSSLHMLGHGFYSDLGPTIVEYGWLIELRISDITAEMSTYEARLFIDWLQTFVFHVMDDEGDLQPVVGEEEATDALLGLDIDPLKCPPPGMCKVMQLKYEFTRVNVSRASVRLLDGECCSSVRINDAFVSKCNLHNVECSSGVTAVIHDVRVSQLMSDQLVANISRQHKQQVKTRNRQLSREDAWLEVGHIVIPEIIVDASMRRPFAASLSNIQQQFLRYHDEPFRRLWFLWRDEDAVPFDRAECGCYGGCHFFDSRRPPTVSVARHSVSGTKGRLVSNTEMPGNNARTFRSVSVPRFLSCDSAAEGRDLKSRSESFPSLLSPLVETDCAVKRRDMAAMTFTVDAPGDGSQSMSRVTSYAESFHSCFEEPINANAESPSTDSFTSAVDFFDTQPTVVSLDVRQSVEASSRQRRPSVSFRPFALYSKYVRRRDGRKRRTGIVGVAASPLVMSRTPSVVSVSDVGLVSFRRMNSDGQRLPRLDVVAGRHNMLVRHHACWRKLDSGGEEEEEKEEEEKSIGEEGEEMCVTVRVDSIDAKISPLCTEVIGRHIDCARRYSQHLHPLRIIDILHDQLLSAVKHTATITSPNRLFLADNETDNATSSGLTNFQKRRTPVVTVTASLDSMTVCAVHEYDCQSLRAQQMATEESTRMVLPIAAVAIGGFYCDMHYCCDTPSADDVPSSSSSPDCLLVSSSIAYAHVQMSAFDSTNASAARESKVAFEIAIDGTRDDNSNDVASNRPVVLLEAGGENFRVKLLMSSSTDSSASTSAVSKSIEGQITGELDSVWASLPFEREERRQSVSEAQSCDVVRIARAVCRLWMDGGNRLSQSVKRLMTRQNERFAKVISCLLTEALLDSFTKQTCAAMLQPMAYVLHHATAVQLIPLLRRHITSVSSVNQVEGLIQECGWSSIGEMSAGLEAVALAWGEKVISSRRGNVAVSVRPTSLYSVSPPPDATETLRDNVCVTSESSVSGESAPLVRTSSIDRRSISRENSSERSLTNLSLTDGAVRPMRRNSRRLSFYSLFSTLRQSSRSDRHPWDSWTVLDGMAQRRDVLGYGKELLRLQKREDMLRSKHALEPLLTALRIETDELGRGRESYVIENRLTLKEATVFVPMLDGRYPPPFTLRQLSVGSCVKLSTGVNTRRSSIIDAFVHVSVQSIHQYTTGSLLSVTRRLITSIRTLENKRSSSSESSLGAQEIHLDSQYLHPFLVDSRRNEDIEASVFTVRQRRPDTFTDVLLSLAEASREREKSMEETRGDDVQLEDRGDGDGSAGDTLRGNLATERDVVITIDTSQDEQRASLDSELPLLPTASPSSFDSVSPLRPLVVSNPIGSISESQSILSDARLNTDESLGTRQPPWGSMAPLSEMRHVTLSSCDDATISSVSPSLKPLGLRGEGVGESIHDLNDVGIDEEEEREWQEVASRAKLTSQSEAFSTVSLMFAVESICVTFAIEDIGAVVNVNDANAWLTVKRNTEGDDRSSSTSDNRRLRTFATTSFGGVVPSITLAVNDHLNTKGSTLVVVDVENTQVVVTNVANGKWQQTVVGVDTVGVDINFLQSVVALHTAIDRSFPMLNREAQSMMDITGRESGYDEVDSPVLDTRCRHKVVVEGRLPKIAVSAVLLPSLSASYRISRLGFGLTAEEITSFTAAVVNQRLEFTSKVELEMGTLPSVGLPNVSIAGQMSPISAIETAALSDEPVVSRAARRRGSVSPRFDVDVDIDKIAVTLTTDMVKHLAVIQSKFVRETADILKDLGNIGSHIAGDYLPSDTDDATKEDLPCFCVQVNLQGIEVLATTPTATALRVQTGDIRMCVSNDMAEGVGAVAIKADSNLLFGAVSVALKVSLGSQFQVDANSEESLFREMAYFHADIEVKGSGDEGPLLHAPSASGKRTLIILIRQPHLFMQPLAFDKGVLLWLKYKEGFDQWQEQQKSVSSDMRDLQSAAGVVLDRLQGQTPLRMPDRASRTETSFLSSQSIQIKVEDLGVAMPVFARILNTMSVQCQEPVSPVVHLVMTVCSANLSILFGSSSEPTLSVGRFNGFTVRTDPEFDEEMKLWTPTQDNVVNFALVPDGDYRVFVQTAASDDDADTEGQLTVELTWNMKGVSVMLDPRIGSHLSALIATMTSLSSEDDFELYSEDDDEQEEEETGNDVTPQENMRKEEMSDFCVELETTKQPLPMVTDTSHATYQDSLFSTHPETPPTSSKSDGLGQVARRPTDSSKRKDSSHKRTDSSHKRTSSFIKDFDLIVLQRELHSEKQKMQALQSRGASVTIVEKQYNVVDALENSLSSRQKARELEDAKPAVSPAIEVTESWGFVIKQPQAPQLAGDATDRKERETKRRPSQIGILPEATTTGVKGHASEESLDVESTSRSLSRKMGSSASLASGTTQSIDSSAGLAFRINVNVTIESGSCLLLPVNMAQLADAPKRQLLTQRRETLTNLYGYLAAVPSDTRKRSLVPQPTAYSTPGRSTLGRHAGDGDGTRLDATEVFIPGLLMQAHYHTQTERSNFSSGLFATNLASVDESVVRTASSASLKRSKRIRQISGSFVGRQDSVHVQKRGKLYVKLSIRSLPVQTVLRASMLSFLEAAMEPVTFAAKSNTEKEAVDVDASGDDASRNPARSETSSQSGLVVSSLPVDVTVVFNVERQRVKLSGEPRLRLECLVETPEICLIVSSALADKRKVAAAATERPSANASDSDSSAPRAVSPSVNAASRAVSPSVNASGRLTLGVASKSTVCLSGRLSNFRVVLYHPLSEKVDFTPDTRRRASSLTGSLPSFAGLPSGIFGLQLDSLEVNLSRRHIQDNSYFAGHLKVPLENANYMSSIQISSVCKVSSIELQYDLRRTSDVEGFVNVWSNTSLMDKLVYGSRRYEKETTKTKEEEEEEERESDPNPRSSPASNVTSGDGTPTSVVTKPWQSCINFALKVSQVNIQSYIGHVMGQTSVVAGPLDCFGSVKVDSRGRRSVNANVRLTTMRADSKSGAVGGLVNVDTMEVSTCVVTGRDCRVLHRIGGGLECLKVRVDHLNYPFFMAGLTRVRLHAKDKWSMAPSDDCDVQLLVDATWKDLDVIISSKTSPALLDSVRRIRDFIKQQQANSRRAFGGFMPGNRRTASPHTQPSPLAKPNEDGGAADYSKHDHWKWVNDMEESLCSFLDLNKTRAPRFEGTLVLSGERFGLACVKGIQFRDSEWALFVLRQVSARYRTVSMRGHEAAAEIAQTSDVTLRSFPTAVSLQEFTIGLGKDGDCAHSEKLLMVEKVSRGRVAPLGNTKDVDEWLNLLCRKEIGTHARSKDTGQAGKQLESLTIFAGPSFDLGLSTIHFWPEEMKKDNIPTVECKLTSSFVDSLSVATDVDLYLFLHKLIMSYRAELITVLQRGSQFGVSPKREESDLNETKAVRLRRFVCTHWQLDPHLKLLFWGGGGHINPHINWVLEKLGFKEARTTIPKWMQRGLLDPLDIIVSSILKEMLSRIRSVNSRV